MNTNLELRTGSWLLVMGPHTILSTLLAMTARLGEGGSLRVLDGGNRFNAFAVARAARGRPEVLSRITVSRAFTCYQVLSLLESTPAIPIPFVVLDFLNTFYDESVQLGERKRLLRACITHLERLELAAGGLVSAHPSKVPSQAALELLEMLARAAKDTYHVEMAAPALAPMRLF